MRHSLGRPQIHDELAAARIQSDLNLGIDPGVNSKNIMLVVVSGDWKSRRLDLLNDKIDGTNGIKQLNSLHSKTVQRHSATAGSLHRINCILSSRVSGLGINGGAVAEGAVSQSRRLSNVD